MSLLFYEIQRNGLLRAKQLKLKPTLNEKV